MLELLQELIAYKYACKLKHWQAGNYGEHLLYDRLAENVDDFVDGLAEKIFMAAGDAEQLSRDILRPELISEDLSEVINSILEKIDGLVSEDISPDGVSSYLGDISKDFLTKLALVRLG